MSRGRAFGAEPRVADGSGLASAGMPPTHDQPNRSNRSIGSTDSTPTEASDFAGTDPSRSSGAEVAPKTGTDASRSSGAEVTPKSGTDVTPSNVANSIRSNGSSRPDAVDAAPRADATIADALGTSDAIDLRNRLHRGDVSPIELRDAATARAYRVNSDLNAVTCWIPEPQHTGASDGPFAGVPSLLKDNEFLSGHPTRLGSLGMSAEPATRTTTWTEQFLSLGFDPIAKTTLPEFGLTASTESTLQGATRNPWNLRHSAGGSSGGSAALVAAGVVPLAHANDGGGSIRIPASCCGIVGLKPSRGRILDMAEREKMPVNLITQGVVTRSVRDTAAYFAAAEAVYLNPDLPPIGNVTTPNRNRLRIGFYVEGVAGIRVSADTERVMRENAQLCEALGHHVSEITSPYPDRVGQDFLRYWAMLAASVKRFGGKFYQTQFDPDLTEAFTDGLSGLLNQQILGIPGSLRRLKRVSRQPDPVFADHDIVFSPVLAHEPPPIGYLGPEVEFRTHLIRLLRYAAFTAVQNITGSPAMSLPMGRSRTGLPIGVQFTAPIGQERRLLELAFELESAAPWPTQTAQA